MTIPGLHQGIRFLPPFAVVWRLCPELIGLAGADQSHVGAYVRAAGAGAMAQHGGVKADDAPLQLFGVRTVDHPSACRRLHEGLLATEDIAGGLKTNRALRRCRRPGL